MGTYCSKPRLSAVTKPTNFLKFKSPEEPSLTEQFVLEKADHRFVLSAFGTHEPNKWDLEKLSRELKITVRPLEKLFRANNPEHRVRLPPVLNSDGSVYFGEWKNDLYDGTGHLFLDNGSQYIGCFANGYFEGPGEMLFANGDVFKGMYSEGKRHGKGILQFKNGDVYDGSWSYGSRHGYGVERFSDGTVFMGNFKNNKRSGHGELKKPDGTHYEGHFNNNQITGIGKMQWPHGETYTGGFRNGLKHGHGTTTWKSGDYITHKGYYREGKMSGNFKIVKRDGSVLESHYQNDEFVRNLDDEEKKLAYSGRYTSRSSHLSSRSSTKLSSEPLTKNSIDAEHVTTPNDSMESKNDMRHSPRNGQQGFSSKLNLDSREKLDFERSVSKESLEPGSRGKSSPESSPRDVTRSVAHNNSEYKSTNSREFSKTQRPPYKNSSQEFQRLSTSAQNRLRYKRVNYPSRGNPRVSHEYGSSHSVEYNENSYSSHYSHDHSKQDLETNGNGDGVESHVPFRKNRFNPRGRHSTRPFRGRRGSSRYTT